MQVSGFGKEKNVIDSKQAAEQFGCLFDVFRFYLKAVHLYLTIRNDTNSYNEFVYMIYFVLGSALVDRRKDGGKNEKTMDEPAGSGFIDPGNGNWNDCKC